MRYYLALDLLHDAGTKGGTVRRDTRTRSVFSEIVEMAKFTAVQLCKAR